MGYDRNADGVRSQRGRATIATRTGYDRNAGGRAGNAFTKADAPKSGRDAREEDDFEAAKASL